MYKKIVLLCILGASLASHAEEPAATFCPTAQAGDTESWLLAQGRSCKSSCRDEARWCQNNCSDGPDTKTCQLMCVNIYYECKRQCSNSDSANLL